MTISAVVPDIAFAGSSGAGTSGPFSLVKNGTPLVFFSNSEVVVLRYDSVTDTTPTLLVEGTDYTLTGGPTAGSITLTSPQTGLLTAERLYVTTVAALAQSLDLVNGGNFSSSNLERRLDVIFQILQQHAREIKSTIRFAMFDTDEIPKTTPLGAVIGKVAYPSGTASNPTIELLDVAALADLVELSDENLANVAIVAADLGGADTIGIVAASIDDVEDVAANLADIGTVATNIVAVNTVADAIADDLVYTQAETNTLLDGKLTATQYDTYAAARLGTGLTVGQRVYIRGRASAGDGGEGWFRVKASGTDDGGTELVMADTKALVRDGAYGSVESIWFGTDAAAVIAAIAAAEKHVVASAGSYVQTSLATLAASSRLEAFGGIASTTITKGYNGDMIDMSASYSELRGLNLNGDGANFTGKGLVIGGGIDQVVSDCFITNTVGAALEFTVADAGQRFRAIGTTFRRTTTTDPAILLPTATESAGNRYFAFCNAQGGTLLKFNSGINTQIIGGGFVNLDFTASASVALRALILGCRIATGGADVTIYGGDVNFVGNMVAGNIVLHSSTQRCKVAANGVISGGTVTDNSTAVGDNVNEIWDAYYNPTIEWKGDSSDPAIGNGTLTCRVVRSGRMLKLKVTLLIGSTTTFGSGAWYFQLPAPFSTWVAKAHSVGQGRVLDASPGLRFTAIPEINAGSRRVYLGLDNSGSNVSSGAPMTWTTSDALVFEIEYEIT